MMIDRLESRRLYASISGYVFNDTDRSMAFDGAETPRAGTTVFIDANANGTFDSGERSTTANSKGVYTFKDLPEGDYLIGTTTDNTLYKSTTATENGTVQGRFNIEFRGLEKTTPAVKNALLSAAQKWEGIIVGDDPDVPQRGGSQVDDLVIDVTVGPIDFAGGALAYAGPTAVRVDDKSYHAYRGLVRIDSADSTGVIGDKNLYQVVLHEIGHVLGIGTNWNALGLTTGRNSRNPRFIGANAVREYNRLFKTVNVSVPLENTGGAGTRGSHWKENALREELMTGYIGGIAVDNGSAAGVDIFPSIITDTPLSTLTVGALEDEGYDVNYAGADEWNPATDEITFSNAKDNLGGTAFERKISVEGDDTISGFDFGYRLSEKPTIKSLSITPGVTIPVDRDLIIRAAGVTDPDGDTISGVTFYRESNGIEGLQKGEDERIGYKPVAKQGEWRIQTSTAGLAGEVKYYVLATDSTGNSGRRTATINVVTSTPPQTEPGQLSVRQRNSSTVRFAFTYPEGNNLGYRVQLSTNRSFSGNALVRAFNIDTEDTILNIGDLRAGERYYIRVRAYNEAGVGGYSQPLTFEVA